VSEESRRLRKELSVGVQNSSVVEVKSDVRESSGGVQMLDRKDLMLEVNVSLLVRREVQDLVVDGDPRHRRRRCPGCFDDSCKTVESQLSLIMAIN